MSTVTDAAPRSKLYEIAVAKILAAHPELHYGGYGDAPGCERDGERERLAADPAHILRVAEWFADHPVPARDLRHRNSYGFKHDAERGLGDTYVSNGQCIAALLLAGYVITEESYNPRFADPGRIPVTTPLEELEAAEYDAVMQADPRARKVVIDGELVWVTGAECPWPLCEFGRHEYCLYDCTEAPRPYVPDRCGCGERRCACDCGHCKEQQQWRDEQDERARKELAAMTPVYRLTTTVCFPGEKRPATRRNGWHYDAATFPVGQHQPFEGFPGTDYAVVCARGTHLSAVDLDLYKAAERAAYEASPEMQELIAKWKPFTTRDNGNSLKYLMFWPDTSWWPAAGKLPGGEMRSGGIIPAPGARHASGGTYDLIPGPDRIETPYGAVWHGNVNVITPEDIALLKRLGLREQGAPATGTTADAEGILSGWGYEDYDPADFTWIAGGADPDKPELLLWGQEGHTESAAFAVCRRLLDHAEDRPESAGRIFRDLATGYEMRPGYAGNGERQMRRTLANAAAGYVPRTAYREARDRALWGPAYDRVKAAEAASVTPGAAEMPVGPAGYNAVPPTVTAPGVPARRRKRTTAAETVIRRVDYLWEPYVPANMITVLGGMEGSGKTQIAFDLAARITRTARPVIILSPEDPREQVTVPRLIAAGADLARCCFYDALPGESEVTLRADLADLGEYVTETGAALVVIDPIVSVLDAETDADSYKEVSRELARLAGWADERHVSVLAITHLRKASDGTALNKMMGSRAFTSKPRSVLMTATHPDEPEVRLLAHAKSNVGPEGASLGYRIEPALIDPRTRARAAGPHPDHVAASAVRWLGSYEMWSAGALMAAEAKPAGRPPKIAQCAEFIRGYLAERGGAAPAAETKAAAMAEGYGMDMLRSAELKSLARVTVAKTQGYQPAVWYWSLVGDDGKWTVPADAQVREWQERV